MLRFLRVLGSLRLLEIIVRLAWFASMMACDLLMRCFAAGPLIKFFKVSGVLKSCWIICSSSDEWSG